jgi:hypothetical protein
MMLVAAAPSFRGACLRQCSGDARVAAREADRVHFGTRVAFNRHSCAHSAIKGTTVQATIIGPVTSIHQTSQTDLPNVEGPL